MAKFLFQSCTETKITNYALFPNLDAFLQSKALAVINLKWYIGVTIYAIASVCLVSITTKSSKRAYVRAKNSTGQRNEQQVYRTPKIVRASSLPRVRPSSFNLFVFFQLFRLLGLQSMRRHHLFQISRFVNHYRWIQISSNLWMYVCFITNYWNITSSIRKMTNYKIKIHYSRNISFLLSFSYNVFVHLLLFSIFHIDVLSIIILHCPSQMRKMRDKIG